MGFGLQRVRVVALGAVGLLAIGCQQLINHINQKVDTEVVERQQEALDYAIGVNLPKDDDRIPRTEREDFFYAPNRTTQAIPKEFQTGGTPARPKSPTSRPSSSAGGPSSRPRESEEKMYDQMTAPFPVTSRPGDENPYPSADGPPPRTGKLFSLTDSFRYALLYQREYQTAKEDLYLVALNLTLEKHLWTPIFAYEFRTVYGNYGEAAGFDQAMRFVSNLGVAQRLPYGGEFTANAISTLIRDVKQSITASEGSAVDLGLRVPLLRGAGNVAQETLIQLERELTYAVRSFERFRQAQLTEVAQQYFVLLRAKQTVVDQESSAKNLREDYERAKAFEDSGRGTLLDTQRAEGAMLSAENNLDEAREDFRFSADTFKLFIGMNVDDPLTMDDLETIPLIEAQVESGRFPLLQPPAALEDEQLAVDVALQSRLDLLTLNDRIGDAKRGVAISENALLPELMWNSNLAFDTDPARFNAGALRWDRGAWRTEMILNVPIDDVRAQNQYRRSVIDVRRAQRLRNDQVDRVRVEVRRALNQVLLNDRTVEIQARNLEVAARRREFARLQFDQGEIGNRDVIEAENEWISASNTLAFAKTQRWNALLQFRLTTQTLRVSDDGKQLGDADFRRRRQ